MSADAADEYADPAAASAYEADGRRYAWSDWQVTATEELCHEFQFRVLGDRADRGGEFLYQAYGPLDELATGHTRGFSTAVAQFAAAFGLDPHRLVRTLKTPFRDRPEPTGDAWARYLIDRRPRHADIEHAAFLRYVGRGGVHGSRDEDWYQAEQELAATWDLPGG